MAPPYDGGWGRYPHYDKKPARSVVNGIRTKSRTGKIGESWWSERWVKSLEAMNMGARLARGKTYARKGQVASLKLDERGAHARVQGSRPKPYEVTIRLKALGAKEWGGVLDALAAEAIFAAELLAGEMPRDVDMAFLKAGASLFPGRSTDLHTACSCPDYANPCKHIAAVHFILAERLDDDPFLLFLLRGATKETVLKGLRKRRSGASVTSSSTGEKPRRKAAATLSAPSTKMGALGRKTAKPMPEPSPIDHAAFWGVPDSKARIPIHIAPPAVARTVLRRLGDAPFGAESAEVIETLGRAYEAASRWAIEQGFAGDAASVEEPPVRTGVPGRPSSRIQRAKRGPRDAA